MKLLPLRPVSNYDRMKNIFDIMGKSRHLEGHSNNQYKHIMPKDEVKKTVENHLLIGKYLPKVLKDVMTKITKG